jgi:hypothetical protein
MSGGIWFVPVLLARPCRYPGEFRCYSRPSMVNCRMPLSDVCLLVAGCRLSQVCTTASKVGGAYVGRRRNGGFWVPGSLFPSVDLEWVFWFLVPPSEGDLSLYNVARFAAVCPVLWLRFRFGIYYGRRNIWSCGLVQERIDGGLAILAILILDLQNKGTDWGVSPVLQGY